MSCPGYDTDDAVDTDDAAAAANAAVLYLHDLRVCDTSHAVPLSQAKHISEEGLKSHIESKKKDAAFASIFRSVLLNV